MTIIDIMQSNQVHMDRQLLDSCNGIFETVCINGTTKLKHPTSLSSLLNIREEENTRSRLKTENIMDDLRNVCLVKGMCVCLRVLSEGVCV